MGLPILIYSGDVFADNAAGRGLQVQQTVPGDGTGCVPGDMLWFPDVHAADIPDAEQYASFQILCRVLFSIYFFVCGIGKICGGQSSAES